MEKQAEAARGAGMARNRMATEPIPKLLITMGLPLMVSLLVQSLYNIVDSIFVARISEDALAATSLAYPVQMLMIALAVGTSVGINALLSRLLGQGKREEVSSAAVTGLFLSLASSLLFILAAVFFVDPIADLLAGGTASRDMCRTYLFICMLLCTGTFLETMVQRFLQASGRTVLSMVSLVVGAGTNMILDPIMIFGYFGCPAMGIRGAAIATVIGQWLGFFVALALNVFCNPDVRITLRGFRLQGSTVLAIYKVGLPTIVMQSIVSLMNFAMNALLVTFSSSAVAFFGVYYKLQNFLFMPINGLGQGALPIIGFNFGAGNGERIKKTIRLCLIWGVGFALLATLVFEVIPGPLLQMFNASEDMLRIGIPAIRIIAAVFALSAVTPLIGFCTSGLQNGVVNMVGAAIRQLVLLVPLAYIFSHSFGIGGTWYAFWIAEAVAATYSILSLRHELKKKVEPLLKD